MARIAQINTFPVEGVVRPELTMMSAAGAHVRSRYILVALTDEAGRVGWGEATVTPVWSGETPQSAQALLDSYFAPALLGLDAEDVAGAVTTLNRVAVGNPFTKAAVEMACWDLRGQAAGQPVWQLLSPNATPQPVPIRGSISAADPEGAVARAEWFLARGLRAVKVKVGVGGPEADMARVRAVRATVGPDIPLGVDANAGWSVEEAVTIVRGLEACNLQYVEQPVARGDFAGMRAVRDRIGVPVMADESVWTLPDVETLLHLDAADIVSVYPGKMGGISPCLILARRLVEAGKIVYIGSNLERDIGTAAMAHLAVGLPGADFARYHSDLVGTLYHTQTLGIPPLVPMDGAIHPPTAPGLGVSYSLD